MTNSGPKTLVLGLGNVLMGDEGVGVYVVRELEKRSPCPDVECLDGGTGGFILLEPMEAAGPHHHDRCGRRWQPDWHRLPHRAALLARLPADPDRA